MSGRRFLRIVPCIIGMLGVSVPAFAQVDLTGSWAPRLYEDYIEDRKSTRLNSSHT